jgi:hypothetical protein
MKTRKHDWSLSGLFLLVMLATYTEASRCFYHGKLGISENICTDDGGNISQISGACLIDGCYEDCCDSSRYAPLSASRINNATICENCGYIWNSTSENCKTSAIVAEAGFGQTGECDSPCGPGFYGPNCTFTPDLGDCCKYHSREVNETVCSSCNGTINENRECLVNHCYDECCSEEDFLAGSLKNPQTCSNCLDEWSYSENHGTGGCITRPENLEYQLGVDCNSPCGSGSYGSDCKNCCEDLIWFTRLPGSTESTPAFAQIHCARCGGTEIRVGTHDNSPVYVCDIERCPCNTNISIVSLPSASELAELSPGDPVNSTCVSECCEARAVRRQVQNTSITNYAPGSFDYFCEQICGGNITYLSSFQSEDSYQYSIVRCAVYEAGVDTCCGSVGVGTPPPEGRTCESCGFVTGAQEIYCEATTTSAPTAPTTTTSPPPTAAPLSACCTSSQVNNTSCSASCGMGSTDWQPLDSSSTVCNATGCCPERNYPYITDDLLNTETVDLSSTCRDCCVTSLYYTSFLSDSKQRSYFNDACESYCGGELRLFDYTNPNAGGYCRAPGCCRAENSYDPGIMVQLSAADINSTTWLLDLRSDACLDCCTQSPYGISYTMGATVGLVDPRFSARCQQCGGEVRELGNLSFQQYYHPYTHYCYIESCCPGTFVGYDISNVNRTDVFINPGGRGFVEPIGDITSACPIDCCAASPVGASTCGKCTASSANLWQALDGDEELCGVSECCSEGAYPRITGQLTNGTSTVNLSSTCSDCCVTSLYTTSFIQTLAQLSYLRDACESYCGGELRPFDRNNSNAGGYCSVPGCCRAENSYDPGITIEISASDINSTTGLLDLRSDACLDCCTQSPYGRPYEAIYQTGDAEAEDNNSTQSPNVGIYGPGTVDPVFNATCQRCGGEVRGLGATMSPLSLQYSHYCYIPACCGGSDYNITDVEITSFSSDWIGNISSACAPSEISTNAPTSAPTSAHTNAPTSAPTKAPTKASTKAPTKASTKAPTKAPTSAPTSAPTKAPTSAPTTTAAPVAEVCLAGEYLESSGPCAGRCFPCKSKVVYNKNDPNFGESGVFPLPDAPSECQKCGITNGGCDKNRKENNKCDELSGYYNEAAPCRKFTSTDNSWYNLCEWEAKGGDPELEIIIVKERIGQCYPCDSTYNPPDAPREILQCSPETCNVNFNRNTTVEMPTIKRLILNITGIRSLPVTGTYLLLGLGIVFT